MMKDSKIFKKITRNKSNIPAYTVHEIVTYVDNMYSIIASNHIQELNIYINKLHKLTSDIYTYNLLKINPEKTTFLQQGQVNS